MRCSRSSAGRSRGPANLRYCAGSHAISGRVKGRDADPLLPAVRLYPGALERIAEPPAEEAAARQRGAGPRVERRPRDKRAAPAISPDLDALRAAGTGSARVKAKRLAGHERS